MRRDTTEATPSHPRLTKAGLLALALAALAALAVLASGCGGSSGDGVAQVGTTDTTTTTGAGSQSASEPNPTAYAACMRSHGVPDFPDPDAEGNFPNLDLEHTPAVEAARDTCESLRPPRRELSPAEHIQPGSGINPSSPAFKASEEACATPGIEQQRI
jgi:hypothetical protein